MGIDIVSDLEAPERKLRGFTGFGSGNETRRTAILSVPVRQIKPSRVLRWGIRKPTETRGPKNPGKFQGLSDDPGGHRHVSDQDKGEPEDLIPIRPRAHNYV